MKRLFIITIILFAASFSYAQIGELVSKAAKAPKKVGTTPLKTSVSPAVGRAVVAGTTLPRATAAAPSVPSTVSVARPANRSWLMQQQRNFKAWQLKKERAQFRQIELKKATELAALEAAKAAAPQLRPELSFTVSHFADYVPTQNRQPLPAMPFVAEPKTIAFRGLALAADGDAVRNILANGLLLKDVGSKNNALRFAFASGLADVKYFVEHPITNATYSPSSAAQWGRRRMYEELPVLTVVKIRGSFEGSSLEVITRDIPASQIDEVIVRLEIDGALTWCKVELNTDGSFTLIPYQTVASALP